MLQDSDRGVCTERPCRCVVHERFDHFLAADTLSREAVHDDWHPRDPPEEPLEPSQLPILGWHQFSAHLRFFFVLARRGLDATLRNLSPIYFSFVLRPNRRNTFDFLTPDVCAGSMNVMRVCGPMYFLTFILTCLANFERLFLGCIEAEFCK